MTLPQEFNSLVRLLRQCPAVRDCAYIYEPRLLGVELMSPPAHAITAFLHALTCQCAEPSRVMFADQHCAHGHGGWDQCHTRRTEASHQALRGRCQALGSKLGGVPEG